MPTCSVEGCDRKVVARRLCAKHYQYFKYQGKLDNYDYGRKGRTVVPVSHPLYTVWGSMVNRCCNPNNYSYSRYGGVGVTVCHAWGDFNNFYSDMHEGYQTGLWLDRIDNNKGYSKENCRWVTPTQSNQNRRMCKLTPAAAENLRRLYITGEFTQSELAEVFCVDQTTVSDVFRQKSWKSSSEAEAL